MKERFECSRNPARSDPGGVSGCPGSDWPSVGPTGLEVSALTRVPIECRARQDRPECVFLGLTQASRLAGGAADGG